MSKNTKTPKTTTSSSKKDRTSKIKASAEKVKGLRTTQGRGDSPELPAVKMDPALTKKVDSAKVDSTGAAEIIPVSVTKTDEGVVLTEKVKADAAKVASNPDTTPQKTVVKKSTVEGPTKLVWEIADQMKFVNPNVRRVDVVNACIAAGIATHTARTQYQRWFTAQKGETK